jgi:hypothetical protein
VLINPIERLNQVVKALPRSHKSNESDAERLVIVHGTGRRLAGRRGGEYAFFGKTSFEERPSGGV